MADIKNKHLDYRVVDRYISKGVLKRTDFEQHLQDLPDSEEEAEWVPMDLHDTEMDEEQSAEMTEELAESGEDEQTPQESVEQTLPDEPTEEI